ncbi:MAG: DedA family protein [Alphaproteobacteria bacterium]|nr:DedA family protein [Alphaproteobacteria bacterium]
MFEDFIQTYGYYAVFIFACIEGEIAVLTAGFLCKQGLMSLQFVMLAAFLGTLFTEQCLFFVGRIYGTTLLEKHPKLQEKSKKVLEFLRKYKSTFIFGSRFIYGIRNFSPIAIGMANISPLKFSTLNVPAAFIWSILVAGAGYVFADALERAKENMQYVQIFALIILCVSLGWFIFHKTKKRRARK